MIKAKKAKQDKKVIKNLIKSMVFDDCIVCNKYNDFVMNNIIKITKCILYYNAIIKRRAFCSLCRRCFVSNRQSCLRVGSRYRALLPYRSRATNDCTFSPLLAHCYATRNGMAKTRPVRACLLAQSRITRGAFSYSMLLRAQPKKGIPSP